MEFKVGDTVKRVSGNYGEMLIGDIDVVIDTLYGNLTLKRFGTGHAARSFVILERKSLRQIIESLHNGWDKEADDIYQELKNNMRIGDFHLCNPTISIEGNTGNNSGYIKFIYNQKSKSFSYQNQCSKNTAFKNLLLWIHDELGLDKPKVGDEVKADIEGKIYKVKILETVS